MLNEVAPQLLHNFLMTIMRIGIITQPLTINYGGILQNYALQQVLKRMGHEVWTIDYNEFGWFDWIDSAWRIAAHKILGHNAQFAITPIEKQRKETPLRRFVHKYISLTKPRTMFLERKIVKKYAFDTIVVGSDQVWRPRYNYNIADCFLKFIKTMPTKRVAYAASFGTDEWEFTKVQTEECALLAEQFDGISVREKAGVELCRKYLGVNAMHVLDPTLLLHASDYEELCKDIPQRKPFVFAYILDESEEKLRQIKEFAKRKGLYYFIKSAGDSVCMDDTVELWLSYFRDASFVITDSFHGTAFAINFNKDFYVFGNTDRGNSRFDSLLKTFRLENRLVCGEIPNVEKAIPWDEINETRKKEELSSLTWLTKIL